MVNCCCVVGCTNGDTSSVSKTISFYFISKIILHCGGERALKQGSINGNDSYKFSLSWHPFSIRLIQIRSIQSMWWSKGSKMMNMPSNANLTSSMWKVRMKHNLSVSGNFSSAVLLIALKFSLSDQQAFQLVHKYGAIINT